jgi:hypothetical protein
MEGVLQGGVGGIMALTILVVAFLSVRARYLAPLAATLNLSGIRFLSIELSLLVLFGGMAVGCIGGILAARARP